MSDWNALRCRELLLRLLVWRVASPLVEVLVKFVISAFVLGVDVVVPGAASDILWTSWGEEGACFRGWRLVRIRPFLWPRPVCASEGRLFLGLLVLEPKIVAGCEDLMGVTHLVVLGRLRRRPLCGLYGRTVFGW